MHLVGCLYNLYQWCTVKEMSDNETYLLIKYIKSVLCRVAKRLSCIEDAWCIKVKCVEVVWNGAVLMCVMICRVLKIAYKACSKKDRTFATNTLLLILQHFKHCPLQRSALYWRYTVPKVSSTVGMLGKCFLWWRAILLSHFPDSPLWFGNDVRSKWF